MLISMFKISYTCDQAVRCFKKICRIVSESQVGPAFPLLGFLSLRCVFPAIFPVLGERLISCRFCIVSSQTVCSYIWHFIFELFTFVIFTEGSIHSATWLNLLYITTSAYIRLNSHYDNECALSKLKCNMNTLLSI